MTALLRGVWQPLVLRMLAFLLLSLLGPARAAFVTFENCLPDSVLNSNPKQLQFTPYFVDATFIKTGTHHPLTLTIYGNVSGQQFTSALPPPSSPLWSDDGEPNGKIVNVPQNITTLTAQYTLLTYNEYDNKGEAFCGTLVNGSSCPVAPAFTANASDPYSLPAFALTHDFGSSYAFSTISATIHVLSGQAGAPSIACISAQITPALGSSIVTLLTWLPAAVLILKGLATLSAAIWSPWGSTDIFKWSSNYGRDEDLLRLVTPGFGDCLQYIQFIVLTGSLTLQYPGFYQPAVSQVAWSTLLFNQSWVSGGNGTISLVDGLYDANATYGLTQMSQLVGMTQRMDIWACMAIWLLVIVGIVVVLCQAGFFGRWIYRLATQTSEEDLRRKNLPFTLGNINRLLFNFFILPIVALSLFQMVIAIHSPTSVIACAVILLLIMIVWAAWILRVIFSTKPRTLLFDDMPLVLNYGPLYNTYSDSAAPFALIPVFITFMRGVAIGAVQPSGIAQIIILAVCEVILILTLNAFRPFQGQTSMNLYHTFFASIRLITVLLMISFVPSLGVVEAPRGWIGYVILVLHACVLVFGFFLNAAQTLVEVLARSLGAGHDARTGAIRGSVLNLRMLKKRQNRPDHGDRASMMSSAAILSVQRTGADGGRSRSISASSQQLLNNRLSGFENFSSAGEPLGSPEFEAPNAFGTMTSSSGNGKPAIGAKVDGDYYRPPRPRKATMDEIINPGITPQDTGDFPYQDSPGQATHHARDSSYDSSGGMPAPAYLRQRQGSSDDVGPRTDYAVREVDQYYRGPALNDQPSRKLKTGPADPTGPASTAQSWFQKLVFGVSGGKKKDQSKGFEVVRSSRMQPGMQQQQDGAGMDDVELQQSPAMHQEPYRDTPDTPTVDVQAQGGAERSSERSVSPIEEIAEQPPATTSFDFGFDGASHIPSQGIRPDSETIGALGHPVLEPISSEHRASMGLATIPQRVSQETGDSRYDGRESSHYPEDEDEANPVRFSDQPVPSLDPIDLVGTIDLPSRFNSNAGSYVPSRFNSSAGQGAAPHQGGADRSQDQVSDLEESQDGQAWLRAVDRLQWSHDSRPNSTRIEPPPSNSSGGIPHPMPSVPRRNSRRTLSQEQAALAYRPHRNDVFQGFDSNAGTAAFSPDSVPSPVDEQLPSSNQTHHVVQHRAGDSITRNSLGASAAMQGSSAEFFGQTPPKREEDDLFR